MRSNMIVGASLLAASIATMGLDREVTLKKVREDDPDEAQRLREDRAVSNLIAEGEAEQAAKAASRREAEDAEPTKLSRQRRRQLERRLAKEAEQNRKELERQEIINSNPTLRGREQTRKLLNRYRGF